MRRAEPGIVVTAMPVASSGLVDRVTAMIIKGSYLILIVPDRSYASRTLNRFLSSVTVRCPQQLTAALCLRSELRTRPQSTCIRRCYDMCTILSMGGLNLADLNGNQKSMNTIAPYSNLSKCSLSAPRSPAARKRTLRFLSRSSWKTPVCSKQPWFAVHKTGRRSRYVAECINARDAINRIEAAAGKEFVEIELEKQSERKRQALRRTQEAAAEARRRTLEAQRLREEQEYLGIFDSDARLIQVTQIREGSVSMAKCHRGTCEAMRRALSLSQRRYSRQKMGRRFRKKSSSGA